jgi:glycosyltransferase involved in cell wall biosynthesis
VAAPGMRLLTLCYEFPPLGGGGARVVHGLTRELVRMGHEVDVVTMGWQGLPRQEVVDGVQVHRVSCGRRALHVCTGREAATYLVAAIPVALRLARQRRYDLNHTHFIFPDGVIAWLLRRRTGLPYVITAHGSDVPGYNPHRLRLAHQVLAPAWRAVVGDAAHLICPSQTIRSLVLRHQAEPKITLISNGTDPDRFRPTADGTRILSVCKMFERKGIQHLLLALEGMPLQHEVQIVGDGPYLPSLQELAARTRVPVRFCKWLDNGSEQMTELYERSGIFVLPSESENFPVVLLEAMAAGLAIVTTKGTGCAEVVGETALLVPPKDVGALREALRRLISDPNLRASLGAAARRRLVENFGWPVIAQQYVALYERHARAGGPREAAPV